MRAMFGLVLVAGVALAGAAVFMTKGYINQTQTALAQERSLRDKTGPLVQVFVVKKEKNYGDVLTKEDVTMIYWQENSLPEGVFKDPKVLFPDDGKSPRYVLRQMEKFEPLLAVKVTEPGQAAGLGNSVEFFGMVSWQWHAGRGGTKTRAAPFRTRPWAGPISGDYWFS